MKEWQNKEWQNDDRMKVRVSEGIVETLNRWNKKANNEDGKWKRGKKKGKAVKIEKKNKEKER